jgi:general secretion pathway protein G
MIRSLVRFWWIVFLLSAGVAIVVSEADGVTDLRITKAFSDLEMFGQALSQYQERTGSYPNQSQGLQALVGVSLSQLPRDPWGRQYIYVYSASGHAVEVYSVGLDGKDQHGGGDDITGPHKKYSCEQYGVGCSWKPMEVLAIGAFVVACASLALGFCQLAGMLLAVLRRRQGAT